MEDTKAIWQHRISYYEEVARPLLEGQGILTIGFSDANMNAGTLLRDEATAQATMTEIHDVFERRSASLFRFAEMRKGDWVIVPQPYAFSVYEVEDDVMASITQLPRDIVLPEGVTRTEADGWLATQAEPEGIDLGFYRKVKLVAKDILRDTCTENALVLRLKSRQTTLNVSDLEACLTQTVALHRQGLKPSLRRDALMKQREALTEFIDKRCTDAQFEELVKWYCQRLLADDVRIPSKQECYGASGQKVGDIDVIAKFSLLNTTIAIQAKRYTGITGDWAVKQIVEACEDYCADPAHQDERVLRWVVSTSDDFDDAAKALADEKEVMLFNKADFIDLLVRVFPTDCREIPEIF